MEIWNNPLLFTFLPPNEVFPLVLDFITVIWDIMRWPICINPTFRLYVPTQSGPWNWKFTSLILLWDILFLTIDDSWLNVCLSWQTIIFGIIWFLSSLLEFIYVSVSLCQQFIMNQKSGFIRLGSTLWVYNMYLNLQNNSKYIVFKSIGSTLWVDDIYAPEI